MESITLQASIWCADKRRKPYGFTNAQSILLRSLRPPTGTWLAHSIKRAIIKKRGSSIKDYWRWIPPIEDDRRSWMDSYSDGYSESRHDVHQRLEEPKDAAHDRRNPPRKERKAEQLFPEQKKQQNVRTHAHKFIELPLVTVRHKRLQHFGSIQRSDGQKIECHKTQVDEERTCQELYKENLEWRPAGSNVQQRKD